MKTVEQVEQRIAEYRQELADTLKELEAARNRMATKSYDTAEDMVEIEELLEEKDRLHNSIDTLVWLIS